MRRLLPNTYIPATEIGVAMRFHRMETNKTQTEVADKVGCSAITISNVECGKPNAGQGADMSGHFGTGKDRNKKRNRKAKVASRTTGKQKGIVVSGSDKFMAKRSRSYKHKLYNYWDKRYNGEKVIRGKKS